MAFTRDQIEYLHHTGKMPDWAYYQQVGKPLWMALQEQQQDKESEDKIEIILNNVLDDIFK